MLSRTNVSLEWKFLPTPILTKRIPPRPPYRRLIAGYGVTRFNVRVLIYVNPNCLLIHCLLELIP